MIGMRAASHAQNVLVNRLATPLGGVLILVIIGRHSDQLLGEYALVMTFYYIMQMLPLLGLTPYVMREVARSPERAAEFFSTIGLLSIIGCLAVDVLCYGFLGLVDYPVEVKRAIMAVGVLIFPGILLFIAELLFMSLHCARPVAVVAMLENTARVVLSALTLWFDGGLVGLVGVFLFTRLCALAVYLVAMRREKIIVHYEWPNPSLIRDAINVIPAFFTGTVLFAVFYRLDFIVISIYEPVEQIGYYAIGYRLFEISIIVLTALIMALFPSVSRKFVGARFHYQVTIKSMILSFFAGLLLICFSGALLADIYVFLLFFKQYPQPVLLTQLFMAALLFAGMDFVASGVLHASDQQSLDTRAMAVGGSTIAILLLLLVPAVGIYGAFVAKLVASLVQGVLKFYWIERRLGPLFRFGELCRLAFIIAVVAMAALLLLEQSIALKIVAIVVMAVVVVGLMLALGLFQPLRLLRFYWQRRGASDVISVADLVDIVVADLRSSTRQRRRVRSDDVDNGHAVKRVDLRCTALVATRVTRFFHLRGFRHLAALIGYASRLLARLSGVSRDVLNARPSYEPPAWA